MLRDKSLIPLSHQHQHALALCVRIERALPTLSDLSPWQAEIDSLFRDEIQFHFAAEERVLFPALEQVAELAALIDELRIEHGLLRKYAAQAAAGKMAWADLQMFAVSLAAHVRKEERQLFEDAQAALAADELERLGKALDEFFRSSGMPGATCRIREN